MSNILLYSGPGVSTTALAHTRKALQELCPTYDVRPTSATELALAPWQSTASLVVVPGGRDLPYVEEMGKMRRKEDGGMVSAQDAVRRWVAEQGGSFVGICAGAYFASTWCCFEQGTDMEVSGPREGLQFYPGECRGTVYKGFVYESDAGARVTRLVAAGTDARIAMHYNGGGAFIDAEKYAAQGVSVLARYPTDDADVAQADSRRTYAGQPAVVHCQVGRGQAVLFGTHPEFSLLPESRPVRLTAAPSTLSASTDLGSQGSDVTQPGGQEAEAAKQAEMNRSELTAEDQVRRHFLANCLQHLGLRTIAVAPQQTGETSTSSAELSARGQLSELVLVGSGDEVQTSLTALSELAAARSSSSTAALPYLPGLTPGDGFAPIASVIDTNDAFHFSAHSNDTLRKCDEAAYDGFKDAETGEADLHQVPKYVIVYSTRDASSLAHSVRRHWNTSEYLACLDASRQRLQHVPYPPLGGMVQYGERVTSTQTMLDKNPKVMSRLPTGFVSFATHQISGRGRGGNSWISPLGCLQFSLVLHIPPQDPMYASLGNTPMAVGPKLVFVQYLAGLAVVDAVRTGLGDEYASVGRRVRLKWPNDIYAEVSPAAAAEPERKGTFQHLGKTWAKMGGILVNSQYVQGRWSLVVGCGVNCLNALPTTSLSALIDEENQRRRQSGDSASTSPSSPLAPISQERLAGAVLASFERLWSRFISRGGWDAEAASSYSGAWLHGDQVATLTTVDPPVQVRIVGISPESGTLRAVPLEEPGAQMQGLTSQDAPSWGPSPLTSSSSSSSSSTMPWWELQPDGNSFDMLQNLIKTKS
ncbi:unnamed protein product [Parajaminaea phylloscopi]